MKTSPDRPLSVNFSLNEFEVSASHPELVTPVPEALQPKMQQLVDACLQPLRTWWGRRIDILSGYRSPSLNQKVGGSPTSQHTQAEAADFTTQGLRDLFAGMLAGDVKIACGQVIYYPHSNFVHVAIPGARYTEPSFFVSRSSKKYERVRTVADLRRLGV